MNHWGKGRFRGCSAGSFPRGKVHPMAVELLKNLRMPTDGLRSKSWNEFATPGSPEMDFIFTVCNQAAGEVCPIWPGHPISAHWGMPDPAAVEGTEVEKMMAFRDTLRALQNRIHIFVNLRHEALDRLSVQRQVNDIGRLQPERIGHE